MAKVYFSLGTNLGDKEENLRKAVDEINKRIGNVISLSAFYKSAPWGFHSENTFLNAALLAETTLTPLEVLAVSQKIEKQLGRTTKSIKQSYTDRIIDIDILLYDDLVINTPELVLPHPLMTQRSFVMKPLREIAPELPLFATEETEDFFRHG